MPSAAPCRPLPGLPFARLASGSALAACLLAGGSGAQVVPAQMAGRPAASPPGYEVVQAFRHDEAVSARFAGAELGVALPATVDVWVVAARDGRGWEADAGLVDARPSGPQAVVVAGPGELVVTLAGPGVLSADAGDGLGVGYDVVVDVDRDGTLSGGDRIDGGGSLPGLWVLRDPTAPGPRPVSLAVYTGGVFRDQRTHYPTDVAATPRAPLVVVSHGWTYTELMYDYIGAHLASYGYVVMAHESDVGFGDGAATLTAAATLIDNVDWFLGNLGTIAGGALQGHVDAERIMLIGHSTGGEAVVRAAHALRDGSATPQHFGYDDLRVVSSIAPVSWFGRNVVDPGDLSYHMFVAGADTDVSGGPFTAYQQCFSIYERGTGDRQATYVHGAGHGDFLGCCGGLFVDSSAPGLIGRPATNTVARGYFLPLAERYLRDNLAAKELFTRPAASFRPAGIAANVTVTNEYRDGADAGALVLDDFQSGAALDVSSSGGAVTHALAHVAEVRMRDNDGTFSWPPVQESNGMTRAQHAGDFPRCLVLDWSPEQPGHWSLAVVPAARELARWEYLSLRVCQGTRHPETVALAGDVSFGIELTDGAGHATRMAAVGPVPPPYARTGPPSVGPGAGWQNEFTTLRVRIADFAALDPALDLNDIVSVRFVFDATVGSPRGRIGLDDVELVPFDELSNGSLVAAGNVGAGEGGPFDVLRLDGSAGGPLRRVDVAAWTPFPLDVLRPPSVPGAAPFALAARLGVPGPSETTSLPGIGPVLFPPPSASAPGTFLLASSLGTGGGGLLPATPAPWSATLPGLPPGLEVVVQGVLLDDGGALQVTNAVLLRVE